MGRFILQLHSPNPSMEQVENCCSAEGVTVVDRSPTMMLVEGEEDAVRKAAAGLEGVTVHAERMYKVPSPHPGVPKVKKPAKD